MLASVASRFPYLSAFPTFHYDTSGTNIQVVANASSLELTGTDTVEHYEQVLRGADPHHPSSSASGLHLAVRNHGDDGRGTHEHAGGEHRHDADSRFRL